MERRIKYIILDVDGTLTDGGIYYDEHGNELKKFSTKDGAAIIIAKECGIKVLVLTGRECAATVRRMEELKVDYLFQNIKDKATFLRKYMEENGIHQEEIAYIGDDLNDLSAMQLVGVVGCPADSCREVQERANYVSHIKGGQGAVRDVIEHILRNSGEWQRAFYKVYNIGI